MDRGSLRSFVARTQALVDPAPPATLEETRTWIVEPLLETLGWGGRSYSDDCTCEMETNRTLEGIRLEYVLSIDGTPGLFVAVESFTDDLSDGRERELRRAMQLSGVDRAMYTNGRELALLAGPAGQDRFQCSLSSLHDAESELEHVSFRRIERRLERHSRAFAARRLAIERADVTDSIVDDLAALAGESYRAELRTATERFVDELVHGFASSAESPSEPGALEGASLSRDRGVDPGLDPDPDSDSELDPELDRQDSVTLERDPSDVASSGRDGDVRQEDCRDRGTSGETLGEGEGETNSGPEALEPADQDDVDSRGGDTDTDIEPDTAGTDTGTDDTEYVVRFFNDRGSVGAIGHSRPDQAMVHAVEYLFDRGLSGISVPWGPENDATVLNDDPVLEDGSAMASAERLSNGYVLNTGGTLEERATRLEALAERAGLRAMLTGDWPESK